MGIRTTGGGGTRAWRREAAAEPVSRAQPGSGAASAALKSVICSGRPELTGRDSCSGGSCHGPLTGGDVGFSSTVKQPKTQNSQWVKAKEQAHPWGGGSWHAASGVGKGLAGWGSGAGLHQRSSCLGARLPAVARRWRCLGCGAGPGWPGGLRWRWWWHSGWNLFSSVQSPPIPTACITVFGFGAGLMALLPCIVLGIRGRWWES